MNPQIRDLWSDRLLRIAIAFFFLYPAVSGFFYPDTWIGYFPQMLAGMASSTAVVGVWGVIEVILALWMLFGKNIKIPSLITGILAVGIVIANPSQMDVIFRDLALAAVSFSLAVKYW